MKTTKYLPGLFVLAVLFLLLYGCGKGDSSTGSGYIDSNGSNGSGQSGETGQTPVTDWLIPVDEVYNGGVGMDGIPALTDPNLITADEAEGDLHALDTVIGVLIENEARAYPHYILDWHEIINDEIGNTAFALTYCPLTGSGIAVNRDVGGYVTTFGVSGLLYNSNLMPYDRLTRSYWS